MSFNHKRLPTSWHSLEILRFVLLKCWPLGHVYARGPRRTVKSEGGPQGQCESEVGVPYQTSSLPKRKDKLCGSLGLRLSLETWRFSSTLCFSTEVIRGSDFSGAIASAIKRASAVHSDMMLR
jgi:hypothetical protein